MKVPVIGTLKSGNNEMLIELLPDKELKIKLGTPTENKTMYFDLDMLDGLIYVLEKAKEIME